MGHLDLSSAGLPDFKKAVISLWFRVPQASLDAATNQVVQDTAQADLGGYFYPALTGCIPLITFGSIETATTPYGGGLGVSPISPSFVGIDCGVRPFISGKPPTLAVNLQLPGTATIAGTAQNAGDLVRQDAFYMSGSGSEPNTGASQSQLEVVADTWHHALIVFDLTGQAVVDYSLGDPPLTWRPGGPTFMWAFDDVDKTDYSLSPCCARTYEPTLPFKQIIPQNLPDVVGGSTAFTATGDASSIASSGNPIGIPTSAAFVDSVLHVEMAELQIFTGVTLDTNSSGNRRAFITSDGKPADPALAATLLGQPPDIAFFGSSGVWINGTNAGSLADSTFAKTGTVRAFTPDPKIGT